VIANQLAAHHPLELALHPAFFEARQRDYADLAVLQRDHVDRMSIGSDTVETEDLARHVEAGHLGAPILEKDSALEEADTHRVEGIERASHTEQALGALHALAGVGDVLEQIEVGGRR